MNIYTSFEFSKRLKEFLGESAPEPMDEKWYNGSGYMVNWMNYGKNPPAYQLHDLLSRKFCEAMANKCYREFPELLGGGIYSAYYSGGLPAVEAALMGMMGGK